MNSPNLFQVDVFASGPLSGNGLSVFLDSNGWETDFMQKLAQEMRQFESIFLSAVTESGAAGRVFTVEEELPFAGHPVLGAAAVLHRTQRPSEAECNWAIDLPAGRINVHTSRLSTGFHCEMDQGIPKFQEPIAREEVYPFIKRLGLNDTDVDCRFNAQVVSTGLPYLIVPVNASGLAKAHITGTDLEQHLQALGAKFILVMDVDQSEIRTWDNLGKVEDIATGSAAGAAVAFLIENDAANPTVTTTLSQGRFTGRPSRLAVRRSLTHRILVSGDVWPVSHGRLDLQRDA